MPANAAELHEDEMEYLDGGEWDNFSNNVRGLANRFSFFASGLRGTGLWGQLFSQAKLSYSVAVVKYGAFIAAHASVLGIGALVVSASAMAALWNFRLFY